MEQVLGDFFFIISPLKINFLQQGLIHSQPDWLTTIALLHLNYQYFSLCAFLKMCSLQGTSVVSFSYTARFTFFLISVPVLVVVVALDWFFGH